MKAAAPFVVMAKPVGTRCNLRCSYCYYLGADGGKQGRMSDETLERLVRQYIEAGPGPIVSFTWHGGEPTLAGLDFYRRAVALQKRHLPPGWRCWNSLQTNGTLLDDEWCAFLAEEKFDVGLSIDGTPQRHDLYRRDAAGRGSYDLAAAAARRLQSHGIQPDLLCTVTSDTAKEPLAAYRALRDLGTGWVQFIPIVRKTADGGVTPDSVSGPAYGDFLCAIFDEWALRDLGRVEVQFFAETLRVCAGGEAALCWMAPTCGRALIVEQDGDVYACDHFVEPGHRLGDLSAAHLGALADAPEQLLFGAQKQDGLSAKCLACAWRKFCNGGCPKDRLHGQNHLCEGLEHFFTYTQPAMRLLVGLRERGLASDAIMAELRERLLAVWKGVGRNDPCPCGSGRKAKACCWGKRPVQETTRASGGPLF